jgi:hypothetical protein
VLASHERPDESGSNVQFDFTLRSRHFRFGRQTAAFSVNRTSLFIADVSLTRHHHLIVCSSAVPVVHLQSAALQFMSEM